MGPIRRFGAAMTMAAMLAGGLTVGSATLEAKGKKPTDPHAVYCEYLENILTYPYVSPYIYDFVLALYVAAGCQP